MQSLPKLAARPGGVTRGRLPLPPGVAVSVAVYLISDGMDLEVKAEGTFRGGSPTVAGLPLDGIAACDTLGIDIEPLRCLASDWRMMTREEAADYDERHPS